MRDSPDSFDASASRIDPISRWPARLLFTVTLLLGLAGIAWGQGLIYPPEAGSDPTHRNTVLSLGIGFAAASLLALFIQARAEHRISSAMHAFADRVDSLAGAMRGWELITASLFGLFLEVLLIRWHGTELRAAAYFKNVTLLASFLGLGLGFAAANRRRLSLMWVPLLLAAQVAVLATLDIRGIDDVLRDPEAREWRWGLPQAQWDWSKLWSGLNWESIKAQLPFLTQAAVFYGFFAALFTSTILIFIPIGQLTGRLMTGFAPVKAYTLNIFGSLAGVVLFGLVSYLWLPPIAWFGIAGLCLIYLLRHERLNATIGGLGLIAILIVLAIERGGHTLNIYSPYQRLEVDREYVINDKGEVLDTGVLISANKAYHLRTANLGKDFVAAHGDKFPRLKQMAAAYDLPYQLVTAPNRVLVVGAGGGNDVAAALRNGTGSIDAVEIDPAIRELGQRYHAEQPYSSQRVTTHVNDARAFMRGAPSGKYDLIVFGLLDSHTLLSGMSAVRLDNFVYTLESIREARRLLTETGTVALSFATGEGGFLTTRLHNMLSEVFGAPPIAFKLGYDDGMMFVAGGAARAYVPPSQAVTTTAASEAERIPDYSRGGRYISKADHLEAARVVADLRGRQTEIKVQSDVVSATDDWPFLYLQGRAWHEIPHSYFIMIGILALISIIWVLAGSGRTTGISPHFFFLGGAFLLIEVKGITELALIYGTTWIVSSVVIAAILLLILLANLFVTVFPRQNRAIHYAILAAALIAGYFVRLETLLQYGWWNAALSATALLVLPLFFAGVIFATSLKQAASLPRVFSSNLLGAILGGLCEYSAMSLGFRNLYLVGLGLYALSFLTMPRSRPEPKTDHPAYPIPPEPASRPLVGPFEKPV